MYDTFLKYFDKISLLTLSSRPDRYTHMKLMLNKMGIDIKNIDVHVTTPFPHNNLIIQAFNATSPMRCFTKPNEYDCARNHYSMVKQAYDEGVEHLLIIEDDICFIKDMKLITEYLENIPSDYDVLQFGGFTTDNRIIYDIRNKFPEKWVMHPHTSLWTTSMYALSRKGMQYYIAFMDKWFTVADMPLYQSSRNDKIVKSYAATIPIVIQADKDEVSSDIRTSESDHINYNTQNMYEFNIKKTDYFSFLS